MSARCVCLTGPTASGKTAAALAIAAVGLAGRPVEIVSVDSALVYRGMDIGTAKPSPAERAQAPHHLIDLLDPSQTYSAACFVADAEALIEQIAARGAFPLLVGGTMLYFKALFDGLDAMPAADPEVRAALAEWLARDGLAALHAELRRLDPVTAARLPPGDRQRILRALEVQRLSGRPLSSFHTGRSTGKPQPPNPPLISLEPDDRAALHRRIDARFRRMLDDGLIEEVRRLRDRGDLHADLPSIRCVGYRQTWDALDRDDFGDLAERGSAATRQLAKRQLTWLRGLSERHRVACERDDAIGNVVALAQRCAEAA